MILREAARRIFFMAKAHRIVTIAGPRQAGKSTLVKTLFPRHEYINLEDPATLALVRHDPAEFLRRHPERIVVDECLLAPELLCRIRTVAAKANRPGQFVLVTSHMPMGVGITSPAAAAKYAGTQFLLPLSIKELRDSNINLERDEYLHRGFMPRAYSEKANPRQFYASYVSYLSDNVQHLTGTNDRSAFERFMRLLAVHTGQIVNPSVLAGEVGVSAATLMAWISALEANFVIFRLPSYENDFGKRVSKVPKFYFVDVGMAASLLGIEGPEQIFRNPRVGNLFENMVVAEALKCRYNKGLRAGLFYYRNQNLIEIDLVINKSDGILPIEIKCGGAYESTFTKNIKEFRKLSKRIKEGYVAYSGETKEKKGEANLVNFKEIGAFVGDW